MHEVNQVCTCDKWNIKHAQKYNRTCKGSGISKHGGAD